MTLNKKDESHRKSLTEETYLSVPHLMSLPTEPQSHLSNAFLSISSLSLESARDSHRIRSKPLYGATGLSWLGHLSSPTDCWPHSFTLSLICYIPVGLSGKQHQTQPLPDPVLHTNGGKCVRQIDVKLQLGYVLWRRNAVLWEYIIKYYWTWTPGKASPAKRHLSWDLKDEGVN